MVALSIAGTLVAYLRFNFSRGANKIFMGDAGSLVVGLILGFLAMKILVIPPYEPLIEQGHSAGNRLIFLTCVLFIPLFDTVRVIIIRKLKGLSPFEPDRNHAHHVLIDRGMSHYKASLILGLLNIFVVGVYFLVSNKVSQHWLLLIVFGLYAGSFLLFHKLKSINSASVKASFVDSTSNKNNSHAAENQEESDGVME